MIKKELIFNTEQLFKDVKEVSGGKPLRDIATMTGDRVSISTLSRISNGSIPDMATFLVLVETFDLEPGKYFEWAKWQRIE